MGRVFLGGNEKTLSHARWELDSAELRRLPSIHSAGATSGGVVESVAVNGARLLPVCLDYCPFARQRKGNQSAVSCVESLTPPRIYPQQREVISRVLRVVYMIVMAAGDSEIDAECLWPYARNADL